MRGTFNLPGTFWRVVSAMLSMSVPTFKVGNVHCVGKLAAGRVPNKRALNHWEQGWQMAEFS